MIDSLLSRGWVGTGDALFSRGWVAPAEDDGEAAVVVHLEPGFAVADLDNRLRLVAE